MKARSKYYLLAVALLGVVFTSCSVGNKDIPTPGGGNTGVDTSNTTLNSFQIIVTGDTSFVMNVVTADSLNSITDDSVVVAGVELNGTRVVGIMGFKTFASAPGTYLTETAPPDITKAEFGILRTIRGVRKIYSMNHGSIVITEHNTTDKTVKGRFDVNNEYNVTAGGVYLRCRGTFYIKYD
jgi:hypothetical protein